MPKRTHITASSSTDTTVTIAGGGPAGTALAAALSDVGVDAVIVDPAADAPWTHRYGGFVDDLHCAGLSSHIFRTWETHVHLANGDAIALGRPYAMVDGASVRQALHRTNVRRTKGTVKLGVNDPSRVIIDATGRRQGVTAWQRAIGWHLKVHQRLGPQMVFMDLWCDQPEQPTFGYIQPLAWDDESTTVFVEETQLATREPLTDAQLRRRLVARLEHLGWSYDKLDLLEERCTIPLDGQPNPWPAYGQAGGMVQPISGYQFAQCMQQASVAAQAIKGSMRDPSSVHRALSSALKPKPQQQAYALHLAGLDVVCGLNTAQHQQFFQHFFEQPSSVWRMVIGANVPGPALAGAMMRSFVSARPSMRLQMLRAVVALARNQGQ